MNTSIERTANEFVIDIIEEAMQKFNLTYEKLEQILVESRYMEMFNDTELMIV